jgi:hypothetical protein
MTDTVWLLWFEKERENEEDIELLIGVYRTEADAKSAINHVKDQPGLKEYPEGFNVYEYTVGENSWTQGFVTT